VALPVPVSGTGKSEAEARVEPEAPILPRWKRVELIGITIKLNVSAN